MTQQQIQDKIVAYDEWLSFICDEHDNQFQLYDRLLKENEYDEASALLPSIHSKTHVISVTLNEVERLKKLLD